MGEFHYSRFDEKLWRRSLMRMKSGGIDIVSSYVIWIHHEETEGNISFEGNLNVRKFVSIAGECGLTVFLRIGPWVHAEVRNGGLPDFMLKKSFEPRTDSEEYFGYVKRFYKEIFSQIKGLQHKDGGPIIGIQIENEYGHCGGMDGEAGENHMRRLTAIAKEVGFDVPYFTATGWGGAVTGGLLPVMGAYCDAPWDPRTEKLEPNPNYLISHERNDKNIGSDSRLGYGLTFETSEFPYLMAELGSALNSTYHRRILIHPEDIGAMTLCKLAGGCNLLGFYMFHGGTNPVGRLTTFEENRASGSLNDMPIYNYDGYAPLDQWGGYTPVYRELKPILTFLHDFGQELCQMPAIIPDDNPKKADDLENVRYSFRTDGKSGYLFVNNYQRGYKEAEHKNVALTYRGKTAEAVFGGLNIRDRDYFMYPFNMKLGSALLKTAKASPLCRINGDYVFYTDIDPEYDIEGNTDSRIITISRSEAGRAYKYRGKKEYLIIPSGDVCRDGNSIVMSYTGECAFSVYPALDTPPDGFVLSGRNSELNVYKKCGGLHNDAPEVNYKTDDGKNNDVTIAYRSYECEDILLCFDYCASRYVIEINGKPINDGYYTGSTAKLSLAYFGYPKKITIKLFPMYESDNIYTECPPEYEEGAACKIKSLFAEVIRSTVFKIE